MPISVNPVFGGRFYSIILNSQFSGYVKYLCEGNTILTNLGPFTRITFVAEWNTKIAAQMKHHFLRVEAGGRYTYTVGYIGKVQTTFKHGIRVVAFGTIRDQCSPCCRHTGVVGYPVKEQMSRANCGVK